MLYWSPWVLLRVFSYLAGKAPHFALYKRAHILVLTPDIVIYNAEDYSRARHKYAIVHGARGRGRRWWPKTPK